MTLKDADLGAVPFDWIGRAPSQMCIAAAFATANWSNESLLLDDVGTPFHSPPATNIPATMQSGKARGIRTARRLAVKNLCTTVGKDLPPSAGSQQTRLPALWLAEASVPTIRKYHLHGSGRSVSAFRKGFSNPDDATLF